MPKLKKINMSKSYEEGDKTLCPGINSKDNYLAKIGGEWFAGKFSEEWYGWNFEGWYDPGLKFDPPGVNCSDWQELYKIVK